MAQVLVVDDDPVLRENVKTGLERHGLVVDVAASGVDALDAFQTGALTPEVIVLDRMMPGWDGLETLKRFKHSGYRGAVIFLTALDEIEDRVEGLQAGADDYLVKPFATEELVARVKARMRASVKQANAYEKGPFKFDLVERTLHVNGDRWLLKPRELKLLHYLLVNLGTIVSRMTLLREVWGIEFDPGTNVVDVHISRLRKHLSNLENPQCKLEAIRGKGYRIVFEQSD